MTNHGAAGRKRTCGTGNVGGKAPTSLIRERRATRVRPLASGEHNARRETLVWSRHVQRCVSRRTRARQNVVRCLLKTIPGLNTFFSRLRASGNSMPRRREQAWCGPAHRSFGDLSVLDGLPLHEGRLRCDVCEEVRRDERWRIVSSLCRRCCRSSLRMPPGALAAEIVSFFTWNVTRRRKNIVDCTGTWITESSSLFTTRRMWF